MAEPEKKEELEVKGSEVKVELTKEVAEKIEETFQKAMEKLETKQKKFAFHGTEGSEKEMKEATSKKEVAEFIRAVARGDREKAIEFSDQRAKALNYSNRDFAEGRIATKTINIAGTLGAGSDYLVPTVFENQILETFDSYDEIIADADVQSFNKPGHIFDLNELSTRVVVWPSDEDSADTTASQPTYTQPQIAIADWFGATDMTLDFLEDTEVDIMADLSRQFGEEMAKKLQARLIDGDVTISGVVTKGITNTSGLNEVLIANTTGGYTTIVANDIENAYFDAISIDHFQNENKSGTWYMNGLTLYNLRKNIRAAANYSDTLTIFDPVAMTLLGRPVKISNQMPTPSTTVSNPFVVYGNLKNHLKIRRKRGITMKVNDSGTTKSGRNLNYQLGRELVVTQRIGHAVVLAEGLTVIAT